MATLLSAGDLRSVIPAGSGEPRRALLNLMAMAASTTTAANAAAMSRMGREN